MFPPPPSLPACFSPISNRKRTLREHEKTRLYDLEYNPDIDSHHNDRELDQHVQVWYKDDQDGLNAARAYMRELYTSKEYKKNHIKLWVERSSRWDLILDVVTGALKDSSGEEKEWFMRYLKREWEIQGGPAREAAKEAARKAAREAEKQAEKQAREAAEVAAREVLEAGMGLVKFVSEAKDKLVKLANEEADKYHEIAMKALKRDEEVGSSSGSNRGKTNHI